MSGNCVSIILCGGRGERLWPYSRISRPKPFIPFIKKETLLEQTINRCKLFSDEIWVVAEESQKDLLDGYSVNRVILEPSARNTAAAIMLASFLLHEYDPNSKAIFLPADPYIPEYEKFSLSIKEASNIENGICLLGIKPSIPATGYGYLETTALGDKNLYKVNCFHEKPSKEKAEQYVLDGDKFWNLGVFIGKAFTFLNEFKVNAPDIYDKVIEYCRTRDGLIYSDIRKISFDHAIAEKSIQMFMLPASFIWSDVGNLDVFMSLRENQDKDSIVEYSSRDNLVDVPGKKVVFVGVENLCVIEQDDVLVIASRDKVEGIKEVLQIAKKRGVHLI